MTPLYPPSLATFKSYLRKETDEEDALLDSLLLRAAGVVESLLGLPVEARDVTAVDAAETFAGRPAPRSLVFPYRPIAAAGLTVLDTDGDAVPTADYRVDETAGLIYGTAGVSFPDGPYTITARTGLSLREDWATASGPAIAGAVLDVAADLYQRRSPGAASTTGGGTAVAWDVSRETVARALSALAPFRGGPGA